MFSVGFDREVFSVRHPSMGISISQLETLWKANLPEAKAAIQPLLTTPLPGTTPTPLTPLKPLTPAVVPSSTGSSSALLWVGGLAVLGIGGWYVMSHSKDFGLGKGKKK